MNTDNPSLNKAFAIKLLRSWLGCLRLEELTSARVDAGDRLEQNIWDQGVQLVGDRLLIERALFQDLKQQWQQVQQQGNGEDFRIAVALPKIYSVERGMRYFHPLFVIDISTIFKGRYSDRGWNLAESFEFQPVLPNLMEFASLSEEDAERLVTQEGIKPFLETTFGHPFNTLQSFLEQVSLPDTPYRAQALPYLVRFSFVAYTYNLKKDLQKILQQQQYWNWVKPGHPAYEFLFGRPADPDRQVFFAGAFPIKPPTVSQALVLKHARVHPLTAVMGAPGTGKSFLIAHEVAVSVVDRAIHLLEQGTDRSNLILVTSTNNRAVQTVEDLFATFDTPFFFLPGGAKERVDQQVIPRLRSAIAWLRTTAIDTAAVAQLSEQILARRQQLQQKLVQDSVEQAQRQADLQLLAQINSDLQALALKSQPLDSPELDYTQFPLTAYEQIRAGLDQIDPSDAQPQGVPGTPRRRSWLMRLWHRVQQWWQKRVTSRDRRALLLERIERAVAKTHTTPFPFDLRLPLTAETLSNLRAEVREQLDKAQNWNQHTEAQTAAQPLLAQKAQIGQRLAAYPEQDFYDRFYQDDHAV